MTRFFVTLGYAGLLRPAPGTWGSLVALALGLLIIDFAGVAYFLPLTAAAWLFGHWGVEAYLKHHAGDPPEVVIDELVGQWVAMIPLAIGASHAGVSVLALWPGILGAFIMFRFFDIAKPGPIGWADRRPGAWGVMLDDVLAGVAAALVVIALAAVAHWGLEV